MSRLHQGKILWVRYDINVARIAHVAALLVQQGMPTSDLFPPNGRFDTSDGATSMGRAWDCEAQAAPFLFLAGRLVLSDPPPRVEQVTLGRVVFAPDDLAPDQILGQLVETVLGEK